MVDGHGKQMDMADGIEMEMKDGHVMMMKNKWCGCATGHRAKGKKE